MKADIHPTYETATVRCSCGNTFTTRSTVRPARRAVQRVPSVLHGHAEAGRHRWSHREVRERYGKRKTAKTSTPEPSSRSVPWRRTEREALLDAKLRALVGVARGAGERGGVGCAVADGTAWFRRLRISASGALPRPALAWADNAGRALLPARRPATRGARRPAALLCSATRRRVGGRGARPGRRSRHPPAPTAPIPRAALDLRRPASRRRPRHGRRARRGQR